MNPPLPTNAFEPTWYRIALAEIGVQEETGPGDNPRIVEYLATTTLGGGQHDEVAWCSAFANWCLKRAGMMGTGKANARSWLSWGQRLEAPKLGCVVVFSRDSAGPLSGHVGFYVSSSVKHPTTHVRVLGGNQNNRVQIADYARSRLLGCRWPRLTPPPIPRVPHAG